MEMENALSNIYHVVVILTFLSGVIKWKGSIFPAIFRLGQGLAKRKIVIFSEKGNNSLRTLLTDSGLFKEKNIIEITSDGDIGRAEGTSIAVFLVYWPTWKEDAKLDAILAKKLDNYSLIVYAPSEHGQLPHEQMQKVSKHRNSTVVNFRGRLLTDILASMMTTGYRG